MGRLKILNPYTEKVEFEVDSVEGEEMARVVGRAKAAFREWRGSSLEDRMALCGGFVEALSSMEEEAGKDITRQMGKPLTQSLHEVATTADRTSYMVSIAMEVLADERLPELPGFSRYIRHEPLGVVLDIAAWNYPLLIAVNVVAPAVLAGNAVILKHSSRTPLCGEAFVKAFERAGAPESLVQAVVASHEVTAGLIQHPDIGYVSFTGSVSGGRDVSGSAGARFIEKSLELGGKDPAYVCGDAPFDFAVENCVDGAFYNGGQSCCAVERVYVEASIYDEFVEAFAAKVKEYVLGDPMDEGTTLGPLAAPSSEELSGQVEDAVDKGGRLVVSPEEFDLPGKGWFTAPSVVCDAPQESALMQEESFGPVIGIRSVAGDEEAIALMNDSRYGLTASIWTEDAERAVRVGERIETGTFFQNRCDFLDPALPWTGVKDSGFGASLSKYGLLRLSRLKSMHLRTTIPT